MNVSMIVSACLLCGSFVCGNSLIKSAFLWTAHSSSEQFDITGRQTKLMPIVGVNSSVNSTEHSISKFIVFCSAGPPVGKDMTEDSQEYAKNGSENKAHNAPDQCGRQVVQVLALFILGLMVGMGLVIWYLRAADSA
jgi:hypothetical protein